MGLLLKGVGGGVLSPFKVKFIGNRFSADVQSQKLLSAFRASMDVQSQKVLSAFRTSADVQSQRLMMAFRITTEITFSA